MTSGLVTEILIAGRGFELNISVTPVTDERTRLGFGAKPISLKLRLVDLKRSQLFSTVALKKN